jgi:glyoxylase-like metal-dependent hydrolase (beta-lactamase superfamily II)
MGLNEILPLHLVDVTFPSGHPQEGDDGPVLAFAVRHSDGVLLFDTGVGSGNDEVDEYFRPRRCDLADALAAHGLSPDDVTAVANSHLHFDHCGENLLFEGRPVYVRAAELRAAREADYTIPEWVGFGSVDYVELEEDVETEIASGVRLLPTPGHTVGHQSLVVETSSGPLVVAGQAVYTLAEWEGSTDPRRSGADSSIDPLVYSESVRRLRRLDPVRVLFSHDLASWDRPSG